MQHSATQRMTFGRFIALAIVWLSGAFILNAAQDSVPDSRAWFWMLSWILCAHLLLAAIYFCRSGHWTRWLGSLIAVGASISFAIMAWRVWR